MKSTLIGFCMHILLLAAGCGLAHAEDITKPYTFNNGEVANAAHVNANFDTAYSAINSVYQGKLYIDGIEVASVLINSGEGVYLKTSKNYVVAYDFSTQKIADTSIYFTDTLCSSNPYTSHSTGSLLRNVSKLYYIPEQASYSLITCGSYMDTDGVCSTSSKSKYFTRLYENDENVTGVPDAGYTGTTFTIK